MTLMLAILALDTQYDTSLKVKLWAIDQLLISPSIKRMARIVLFCLWNCVLPIFCLCFFLLSKLNQAKTQKVPE